MNVDSLSTSIKLDDLRSIEDLVNEHPNILSVSTLRWQLRSRDSNGLGTACVRVGHRVLISKSRYEQWLATRTEAAHA